MAADNGYTHVVSVGPEDAPPVIFLPGGNFLNPTCLRWFLTLAEFYRIYAAPDIVGQPGRSAPHRPSPNGDGHAFWMQDVLDALGIKRAPFVGLSYGAGIAIRAMGRIPARVSQAALVSPSGIAAGPIPQMLARVVTPMLYYRLRPSNERLMRAARPILTEPEEPFFGPAIRQLGAVYQHVRLDTGLPRMATKEELAGFKGPVTVFACEKDVFFPAQAVLRRAREVFPNLDRAECLEFCHHVPSRAALEHVNECILASLKES